MASSSTRYIFPDQLRGILICFVVLGHVVGLYYKNNMDDYWSNPLIYIIYSFHMPLFIALSGFFSGVSKKKSLKEYLNNRFQRLLYPILTIALICLVTDLIFHNITSESIPIYKSLYKYLKMYWYLDCLLLCSTIIKVGEALGKFAMVVIVVINLLLIIYYEKLPAIIFKDIQLVRQLPLFLLSYYLGKNKDLILIKWFEVRHLSILGLVFWILIKTYYGNNLMEYPCYARILTGAFSSLFILYVISLFHKFLPSFFITLGINSLGIYIIHVPMFKSFPSINSWAIIITIAVFLIIISCKLTIAIKKTVFSKFILGE